MDSKTWRNGIAMFPLKWAFNLQVESLGCLEWKRMIPTIGWASMFEAQGITVTKINYSQYYEN